MTDAEWSKLIKERDMMCQFAGCNCRVGEAHHWINTRKYKNTRYLLDNGIMLCFKHHRLVHDKGIRPPSRYFKKFITQERVDEIRKLKWK